MKTLACILVAVSLATFVVCDEFIMKACNTEANVTPEEIHAFIQGGMKPEAAKDNIKCHMKCVMEKEGYFIKGVFLEDAAIKALKNNPDVKDVSNIEKIIGECKNEKGANDCDTAYDIVMCFVKKGLKFH